MQDRPVMLVTGASKGIGLATVIKGLKAGYRVAATSRNQARLEKAVAEQIEVKADQFIAVSMEFNQASIAQAVATVQDKWGRIDVLVNNAGYAVLGAFEEFSLAEVQANFNVNVFGLIQMTQAVLPLMRAQRAGKIINIASISGTVTGPGQAIYSATKAAVIMMSEALADEVAPFGIQVTAVGPSGVRTDFLDDRSKKRPQKQLPEYQVVRQTMAGLAQLNHNQSGDPELVGQAIITLAQMEEMPRRLYLGNWSLGALQQKIGTLVEEINRNVALSQSIDWPVE